MESAASARRSLRPRRDLVGGTGTPFRQGLASLQMSPSASVNGRRRSTTGSNISLPATSHRRLFADITADLVNNSSNSNNLNADTVEKEVEKSDYLFSSIMGNASVGNTEYEGDREEEEAVGALMDAGDVFNINSEAAYYSDLYSGIVGVDKLPSVGGRRRYSMVFIALAFILSVSVYLFQKELMSRFLVDNGSSFTVANVGPDILPLASETADGQPETVPETQNAEFETELATASQQPSLIAIEREELEEIVQRAVNLAVKDFRLHDAGFADFASADAGALIVNLLTSETCSMFNSQTSFLRSVKKILWGGGFRSFSPELAISDPNTPGNCWPMSGSSGNLTVKLIRPVIPAKFSVEHILPQQSLERNIKSAPKDFEIFAGNVSEPSSFQLMGRFVYDDSLNESKQLFTAQFPLLHPVDTVQMRILSNHGKSEYTCIYRVRVHP